LRITLANTSDAATLAALAERTFVDTFGAANTPDNLAAFCVASYGEAIQRTELADPDWRTWIAWDFDRPAGFVQIRQNPAPGDEPATVELRRCYVDKPWHGRGVATALLEQAITGAGSFGATRLWLSVWQPNARAIAFYRKHAFAIVGETVFVVGTDPQTDWVMARAI
jgi:diamine N-acetyltransferase